MAFSPMTGLSSPVAFSMGSMSNEHEGHRQVGHSARSSKSPVSPHFTSNVFVVGRPSGKVITSDVFLHLNVPSSPVSMNCVVSGIIPAGKNLVS